MMVVNEMFKSFSQKHFHELVKVKRKWRKYDGEGYYSIDFLFLDRSVKAGIIRTCNVIVEEEHTS